MKTVAAILLQASLLVSNFAIAGIPVGTQLTNSDRPQIKMVIIESTKEGVPTVVGFSKGTSVLIFAKVSSNDDAIDISEGEVYNVRGPQDEGEVCNLNAKLSFSGKNIKIDFNAADVGTEFFRSCSELSAVAGTYKK